jgi:hypothetical protein
VKTKTTASECFFVPVPVCDAYWAWKSRLGFPDTIQSGQRNLTVIDDRVDEEVMWRSRWGVLTVEGRTDFIPVQGGCVLYVKFAGAGFLPRVLLHAKRPCRSNFPSLAATGATNRKGLLRLLPRRTVEKIFGEVR